VLHASCTGDLALIQPGGSWTAANGTLLEQLIQGAVPALQAAKRLQIDFSAVRELDTLGAWLLEKASRNSSAEGGPATFTGVASRYAGLIDDLHTVNRSPAPVATPQNPVLDRLEQYGRKAFGAIDDLSTFLQMLGAIGNAFAHVVAKPRSLRFKSLVSQLYRVGWQAIPIIALVTFLIGAIIAQQGIFHFRKFGAESYVVDLVGILVLREIGVLIVAIMVAGRSGSAYTAELGSMKMREEIDALSTMGLDPVGILILPRIAALILALPILAFIGSMSALYGGGLVAWFYGGMSPAIFIARLHEAVSMTHFEVGIIKAPFMALVIGVVACSEGLRVKGSAESLGRQTTTSVVKSIFLVIVLDGAFAVFFASIGM
jgi:phospholipid/cholesterol/gamma-HCH transport system permease protein